MPEAYVGRTPRGQSLAVRLALALGAVLLVLGLVSATCLWALFDIDGRRLPRRRRIRQ